MTAPAASLAARLRDLSKYEGEASDRDLLRAAADALERAEAERDNLNAGAADLVTALAVCNKERIAAEAIADAARAFVAVARRGDLSSDTEECEDAYAALVAACQP